MSTSLARIAANRLNGQKSSGPVTPAGKAKASLNALKGGLFSALMVVPSTGETVAEFDQYRRRIVSDLAPCGFLERELALRVAGLLWRLRRVATHEAAAWSQQRVALPPHPDEVDRMYADVSFTIPPTPRPRSISAPPAGVFTSAARPGGHASRRPRSARSRRRRRLACWRTARRCASPTPYSGC